MTGPLDRELAQVARRLADDDSARLAAVPAIPQFPATIFSTSPLKVTWRGAAVAVAGKNANYTPVIGDRVSCRLVRDQLLIDYLIN